MSDPLTERLRTFIQAEGIAIDKCFQLHPSGVHSVVNCVFSAQARFDAVVIPMLNRLNERLPDTPALTFQEFVTDVDDLGPERYAAEVLNRQKLARRPKVEVARDVAVFLSERRVSTRADFEALTDEKAEQLVLIDLVCKVKGIGPTLAHYLTWLMGREQHVKVDSLLTRLFRRLEPTAQKTELVTAIRAIAAEMNTTPARLDNALWRYESQRGRSQL
ncbi:hypothetical protein GO986_07325 [Deinococcus sp. HMF7620]|uniref:HhH-GPD domain-containing protein n=1 Tax=Deinococcus arboris TaxID=2682977 RepID=A0A7C9HQZ0_9DEIO|nr:hypothetical protein [Deinococcus arboris]MVN86574.1 hypothetical protein [Deinococcus arboris]